MKPSPSVHFRRLAVAALTISNAGRRNRLLGARGGAVAGGNLGRAMIAPLRALLCLIVLLCHAATLRAATDRFGGATEVRREATGFFRVEKLGERWYFITPEGHPFIALGANHVGSYLRTQADSGGFLALHDNDPDRAAEALFKTLRDLGLNAGDAYQPDARYASRLPWVFSFNYLPGKTVKHFNVFDAAEVAAVSGHVTAQCRQIADNPWVLGVAGPDLPSWDSSYVHPYRIAASGSAARKGYEAFLRQRHANDIASLNAAYGTRFPSWEALADKPRLNWKIDSEPAVADEKAFLALVADKHFAIVRAACKAGAPHHLYFGERTQLRTLPDAVLEAMAPHIDVFCTQSLIRLPKNPPEWQVFQRPHYDHEFALVEKPVVIIDWAAPFTLREAPEETEYGTLKPEAEAATEAAQFVRDAFEPPYMIGLFICQVIGTHGNDRFFTRAKRTYLRDDGTPFDTRTEVLRKANTAVIQRLYQTAALSNAGDGQPLFNGKDLDGWVVRSGTATFEAKDGMIIGTTVPMSPNSFLCTKAEYGDFELELEVKCDPGLNSGIQIRSQVATEGTEVLNTKDPENPKKLKLPADRVYGYQVEIASQASGRCGGVYDEARRFVFLDEPGDKPGAKTAFKDGEWNHYRIRCQSDRIQTWVNGILCADVRDSMDARGIIGLQVHGNISVTGRVNPQPYEKHEVRFREIRLRELGPATGPKP